LHSSNGSAARRRVKGAIACPAGGATWAQRGCGCGRPAHLARGARAVLSLVIERAADGACRVAHAVSAASLVLAHAPASCPSVC
jgi:hypothetical protein